MHNHPVRPCYCVKKCIFCSPFSVAMVVAKEFNHGEFFWWVLVQSIPSHETHCLHYVLLPRIQARPLPSAEVGLRPTSRNGGVSKQFFVCPLGRLRYRIMPFVLCNATSYLSSINGKVWLAWNTVLFILMMCWSFEILGINTYDMFSMCY